MPDWDQLRKEEADRKFRAKHGLPSPEAEAAAQERSRHGGIRHALHEGQTSHRPLSKDYDMVGIAGEQAFAEFMGVEWDTELRPQGTNNINFTISGKTVNVATARHPKYLLVEVGKAKADLYVLAMYREGRPAHLMGWATKADVLAAPKKDIGGHGIVSHYIAFQDLEPMDTLRDLLKPPPVQETLL